MRPIKSNYDNCHLFNDRSNNLRGKVIPVIDLRLKFEMNEVDQTNETCIIVVDVGDSLMGVIVDRVSEVIDIKGSEI